MSSVPGNPLPHGGWRLRHSAWIVPAVLGGLFTWVAFLYIGLRARRRDWLLAAAGYAAVAALVFANDDGDTGLTTFATLASWIGGTAHAVWVNRTWLRWRAQQPEWYQTWAEPAPPWRAPPPVPPAAPRPGGDVLGVGDPAAAYYAEEPAAPTEAGHPLDVNTATQRELAALPGIGARLARRITAERRRRDGFADLDELAAAVDLPPHLVVRLRPLLRFDAPPRRRGRGPGRPGGRVLDV